MKSTKQNILLIINKILLSLLLTIGATLAYAGQNVAKFYGKPLSKNSVFVWWLDINKEPLGMDSPITLEWQAESYYYLYTDDDVEDDGLIATMEAQDANNNTVGDISITSLLDSHKCIFTKDEGSGGWFCKVRFFASESSPLEDPTQRSSYSYRDSSDDGSDFSAVIQPIYIYPPSDIGTIYGVGPDAIPNVVTAIAVSDNDAQDNIPLTMRIKDAKKGITKITLDFKFENTAIADSNGKDTASCTIESISEGVGACENVPVTPHEVGQTRITFLASSKWYDSSGAPHAFSESALHPILINVGTLFAGYDGLSAGTVYRKGSQQQHIGNESNGIIRGLVIDEPHHKLYALTPTNTYRQESVTESKLNLTWLAAMPYTSQTLGLGDVPNRILVGSTGRNFCEVTDKYPAGADINCNFPGMFNSIWSSAIDPANNKVYFSDRNGGIGIYISIYGAQQTSRFEAYQDVTPQDYYMNMQVAAYGDKLYVSADYKHAPDKRIGSKLFLWNAKKEEMAEVLVGEPNPFVVQENGAFITLLLFSRVGNLYAGSNDGKLYILSDRETSHPKWKLLAATDVVKSIYDSAIDNNGNIYVSGSAGAWKIPFDQPQNTYQLNNYGNNVRSIVIDNNLRK